MSTLPSSFLDPGRLIAALIALYFFGKKAQKKQEEQQAQISC